MILSSLTVEGTIAIISSVVGIIATVSGLYLKFSKRLQEKRKKKRQREEKIDKIPETMERLERKLDENWHLQENNRERIEELSETFELFAARFDHLETTQLRYMINDAFLGYNNIHEVSDEQLLNAADCCDIYLSKGLNHKTGAKCKLIAEEVEKRARLRAEGDRHEH